VTPDELREELAKGRVRPAYLFAGEEALFRDQGLAAVRAAALGEAENDFDFERLDGERVTAGALVDALRVLPVLAPRRLVVLREPEARRGKSDALLEALAGAVRDLAAQDRTVLAVSTAKVDKRSAWVRAFAEPNAFVVCDPPKAGRAVAAWVSAEARRLGIGLGPGAAEALSDAIGPQLLRLSRELEKAALFAGPGERVTRAHVQEAVAAVSDEKTWDLTDAIFDGRSGDALAALAGLLAGGAPALVLISALATHLRRLVRAREGEPVAGHPVVVRRIEAQAQRNPLPRLLAGLRATQQAEERLKGLGKLPEERVLERLVLSLAG
jgi:DNA polymerase-3 subunit delta